jgi:hypothetical protein
VDADEMWLVLLGDPPEGDTEVIAPGTYKTFAIPRLMGKFYVTIQDADAYIIYNSKTYYPENGTLTVEINSTSTQGTDIGIGNAGTEEKAFHVMISWEKGAKENPFEMQLGNVTTNVEAGNDKGVYYTWTPTTAGKLIVKLLDFAGGDGAEIKVTVTKGDISVQHSVSYTDGILSVELEVTPGDVIEIEVNSQSSGFKNPAATIVWEAVFA